MALGDPISGDRIIYRAIRPKYLPDKENINEGAFLLTPADEGYLSFGADIAAAVAELTRIRYVAEIKVSDILALGLQATEGEHPGKVRVLGIPLPAAHLEMAYTLAKDLRNRSKPQPVPIELQRNN